MFVALFVESRLERLDLNHLPCLSRSARHEADKTEQTASGLSMELIWILPT